MNRPLHIKNRFTEKSIAQCKTFQLHGMQYYTLLIHTRLHTNTENACDFDHNNYSVTLHYNACTIIILLFLWYNYLVGPMARPGARELGLGLKYEHSCCGPGLGILFAGRAGPGPHNTVCGPGPGWVCTTAAGPGRAWASNHTCGPGLGLNFRPVQGPSPYGCCPSPYGCCNQLHSICKEVCRPVHFLHKNSCLCILPYTYT